MLKNGIKNNIVHFWLDYLEVYASCKYEKELFDSLDFDNSNTWEIEDFVYIKTEVPKYKYKILFSYQGYPVFAYYKGDRELHIPTKDLFVVYGTAFKLLSVYEIRYFIEWYLYKLTYLRRFDLCFDTPFFIVDILKKIDPYKAKWSEFYDSNWDIATKYFWEKVWSKNKRHLIRVYNKILDIVESKKIKLYKDYLQFDALTRIEIEVRSELARNISYSDIWKTEIQKWIFRNYLSKRTKLFDFLSQEKITLYRVKKVDINSDEYQSLYYKTQRKEIFLWHARSIYNMWFCPVRVLIAEGYITDQTKKILGYDSLEEIIFREKRLKNEFFLKKQKKRDFQNLLDHSLEYEDGE